MIGIHPDLEFSFTDFTEKYCTILEANNIPYQRLNVHDIDFWEKVSNLDHFIYRFYQMHDELQIAKDIMPVIEKYYGVKTFPDQNTCWHFDDKIRQYLVCQNLNLPYIKSYFFYSKNSAMEWVRLHDEWPIVFKSKIGASSDNVILAHSREEALELVREAFSKGGMGTLTFNKRPAKLSLEYLKWRLKRRYEVKGVLTRERRYRYWKMDKNYALFQKFLPNNDYDTRITVIGDRAFGFTRINRKNDFRSSGGGNIDHNPDKVDLIHVKNAFRASEELKSQSMAYDFLYSESGESQFCEISYNYVDWAIELCPGYWDKDLNWHEGNFWPQYFQLMDLLEKPDLIQPYFENPYREQF